MISNQCQQLIDNFFEALQLKKLNECQDILQTLNQLAQPESDCQLWHIYLTGIFTMEFHHDFAESERLLKSLLEKDLEPVLNGRVLNSLGFGYQYQGRWQAALNAFEQSLSIFDQLDRRVEQVKVWKNMAATLHRGFARGEFSEADLSQGIDYCQQALDTLAALKSLDHDEPWLEAVTWNDLGLIYRGLGNWSKAIYCYEQCLDLYHTLDDRYDIGMIKNNLGEVLQCKGAETWPEA
ncbi:MAG: tetratricopeptide repeat protein, partial [Gammaproteobacteria bacterium]|nr:tetratricopeptide repeat protein [Gammaproteobacteria bacterium]